MMDPLGLVWLLLGLGAAIWFIHVGFEADSRLDQRWLPPLAIGVVFSPFVLALALQVFIVPALGLRDEPWGFFLVAIGGLYDLTQFGLLALMLYLIARRLPREDRGDRAAHALGATRPSPPPGERAP